LLGEIFSRWSEHKAMRLGAALAYYGIFATAPVLIIIIAISGLFYGQAASESKVINAIAVVAGSSTAQFVRGLVESASQPHQGVIAAIVGIAGIILGSTGLFFQLKDALNTIWEVAPKPGVHFWDTIRDNALSFAMVLGLGVLMLVALVLTAGVNTVGSLLGSAVPVRHTIWRVLNYGLSLSLLTLLFAGIFKFLPDVHVHWRDVWVGAILTALLFSAAQWLLGVIIRLAHPGLAFGAAKAVIVILLWFNVVSLILLFGAEFICAHTRRYGTPAIPKSYAKPVTHAAKALQGMPVNEQSAAISRQKTAAGCSPNADTPIRFTLIANGCLERYTRHN
jgi:membrane protein